MNEEVQQMIQRLHSQEEFCEPCELFYKGDCYNPGYSCSMWDKMKSSLEIIDSLSADLAEAEEVNDGLSIMLTAAQSAAETFRRERDALLADLKEAAVMDCSTCKYYEPDDGRCEKADFVCRDCSLGLKDCPCHTCEGASNWHWRGVKTDDEAGD